MLCLVFWALPSLAEVSWASSPLNEFALNMVEAFTGSPRKVSFGLRHNQSATADNPSVAPLWKPAKGARRLNLRAQLV